MLEPRSECSGLPKYGQMRYTFLLYISAIHFCFVMYVFNHIALRALPCCLNISKCVTSQTFCINDTLCVNHKYVETCV